MTSFTDLVASVAPGEAGDARRVTVSDDWLQGRTLYGGLSAALCLHTATSAYPDLPPLRSVQLSFFGPATGGIAMTPTLLRRGKSAVYVGVDLAGEAGLAARATFCFGAVRPSVLDHVDLPMPPAKPVAEAEPFVKDERQPIFMQHFEPRFAGGRRPFGGGAPTVTMWLRHRDEAAQALTGAEAAVAVLALADAPPPAAMVLFQAFMPISTMTWQIDVLADNLATTDGWWLVRTSAETARSGYSGQAMTLWNADGAPVMAARQMIAIFG